MGRRGVMGTVYLLHFDAPYKHARHYIGFTEDLSSRVQAHASGNGARLITVITQAGIGWQLARTWPGPVLPNVKSKIRVAPPVSARCAG